MSVNAATRVFGTTELLEMILFEFVEITKSVKPVRNCYGSPLQVKQPAIQLFPLRRICKGALLTINGSPKLRQSINLDLESTTVAPCNRDYTWESLTYAPFKWFLHFSGIRTTYYDHYGREIECSRHFFPPGKTRALESVYPSLRSTTESSWRDIKLAGWHDSEPFTFTLRFSLFCGQCKTRRVVWKYTLCPQDTLGQFYDEYLQGLKDAESEFVAKDQHMGLSTRLNCGCHGEI